MDWLHGEPRIDDIFADPIITALMRRDRVDVAALRAMLSAVDRQIPPDRYVIGSSPVARNGGVCLSA